jgi:hypothetical protein
LEANNNVIVMPPPAEVERDLESMEGAGKPAGSVPIHPSNPKDSSLAAAPAAGAAAPNYQEI